MPALLRTQARLRSDEVAVVDGVDRLTFGELEALSLGLGAGLAALGAGRDTPIGLFAEPSLDLLVGAWGVLQAGAAYVPLSPDYPEARLAYMLENSGVRIVVCQEGLEDRLAPLVAPGTIVVTPRAAAERARADAACAPPEPDAEGLAYTIYTSGSTGAPKGVMIEARSIAAQMRWLADAHGVGPGAVVLQKTPISFDAAQWEMLACAVGARVVLAEPGSFRDPERLVALVRRHGVTMLQGVPTLLQALVETEGFEACDTLRTLFSGGEMLSRKLAARCLAALPACGLVNLYGPTECTINATSLRVERAMLEALPEAVPIGFPVDGAELLVLDAHGRPADEGELYIGGVQVARGYAARPDLTAERFVDDPLGRGPVAGRFYRTGDLVRRNPDGAIQFLCRADNQVKLRGYRVELDEIRTAIEQHDWVKTAAVFVQDNARTGHQDLVACVALSPKEAALMDQGKNGAHHRSKASRVQVRAQLAGNGFRDAASLGDAPAVALPGRTPTPEQERLAFARKTYRFYDGGEVRRADVLRLLATPRAMVAARDPASLDRAELGALMRHFGQFVSPERLLPKFAYASPGALYATQIHLEIRGIAGLEAGLYYYHPVSHSLHRVATALQEGPAALTIHLVGKRSAIEEVYKANVAEVLELEAGHVLGVFDAVLPGFGLGVATAPRTPSITSALGCADDDLYLGSFAIAPAAARAEPEPLDVLVQAHPGRMPDLPAGQYRYRDGTLERIGDALVLKKHVVAINQRVYERASFGIGLVARPEAGAMAHVALGRALQRLQMNGLGIGLMSSGYSSKSGDEMATAIRLARILGSTPEASYFCVGGKVSDDQIASRGMNEDRVHMQGPAELIKEDLQSKLPDYMTPSRIVVMDALPQTSNGKVDVKALRADPALADGAASRPVIAPRSPTETRIAALWRELLKQEEVSVVDDFFEVGGNSLVAVSLVNRINRTFGCALPLQTLFEKPTIEGLASRIADNDAAPASRLVRLASGTGAPIVCWPGLGGYPMGLRALAGSLGAGRPFLGVQAHGINAGEAPYAAIAEMAAADIAEIRRLQPHGPYTLWGYSFGARVAFEAAHQLEQAGERVENLFLIAPGSPEVRIGGEIVRNDAPGFENKAFVAVLHSVFARSVSGPALDACLAAAHDEASFAAFVCDRNPNLDPDQVRRIVEIVRLTYASTYAFEELVGRRVRAPVTIFKAQGDDYSFIEGTHGFSAAPPTVVTLCADHYAVLEAPAVLELVGALKACIAWGRTLPAAA